MSRRSAASCSERWGTHAFAVSVGSLPTVTVAPFWGSQRDSCRTERRPFAVRRHCTISGGFVNCKRTFFGPAAKARLLFARKWNVLAEFREPSRTDNVQVIESESERSFSPPVSLSSEPSPEGKSPVVPEPTKLSSVLVPAEESAEEGNVKNFATAFLLALVAGVITLSVYAAQHKHEVHEYLIQFSAILDGFGPLRYVAFSVTYILLEIIAFPAIPFTLSSGFLFGLVPGTIVISISSSIAAAISFLIGRYIARDYVVGLAKKYKTFQAIDQAIGKEGFKIVALLRLSPLLPFSLSNYLYGLTAVKFWPYVLASWLGMLPGTFVFVYTGTVGKMFAMADESGSDVVSNPALVGLGLASIIAILVVVGNVAKDALEAMDVSKEDSEGGGGGGLIH